MSEHREKSLLVEATRRKAQGRRNSTEELLQHSDQGSQYTSHANQVVLAQLQLQVIMGGKGNSYNNAVMESFASIDENQMGELTNLSEPFLGQTHHFGLDPRVLQSTMKSSICRLS